MPSRAILDDAGRTSRSASLDPPDNAKHSAGAQMPGSKSGMMVPTESEEGSRRKFSVEWDRPAILSIGSPNDEAQL
jgi:hypothetical protein